MKTLTLVATLLACNLAAAAPEVPRSNFVYVEASGQASAAPDRALLRLEVQSGGSDMEEAARRLRRQTDEVAMTAAKFGAAKEDIDGSDVVKTLPWDGNKRGAPVLETKFQIVMRDPAKAVALAEALLAKSFIREFSIWFECSCESALRDAALKSAIDESQKRAELLARSLGRKVGAVLAISQVPMSEIGGRLGIGSGSDPRSRPPEFSVSAPPARGGYSVPSKIGQEQSVHVLYSLE